MLRGYMSCMVTKLHRIGAREPRFADGRVSDGQPRGHRLGSRRQAMRLEAKEQTVGLALNEAQSPYKATVWTQLTPRERLRRSWAMRARLPDPQAVHDQKLFPKP